MTIRLRIRLTLQACLWCGFLNTYKLFLPEFQCDF